MIFIRSKPARVYRNYLNYRPQLRRDFLFRCAYCLTHEYFLGGEAGCTIDHFYPKQGLFARLDLIAVYINLYWCCRECNENKGEKWPSVYEFVMGYRFLDPCDPADDHDLHWRTLSDGSLDPLTPAGEYTIEALRLWRPQLQHHRAQRIQFESELNEIDSLLHTHLLTEERRILLERRLAEIRGWIDPPVFNRPRNQA